MINSGPVSLPVSTRRDATSLGWAHHLPDALRTFLVPREAEIRKNFPRIGRNLWRDDSVAPLMTIVEVRNGRNCLTTLPIVNPVRS